ncbi:palmitoyltransferase ZDHHC18-A isoform X1 [Erpetoichthys calabaricus]|uniref:GPI mannosyltransferase 2 n=1 Tax=Erpetoichthys calabaricus TaxID=27687 RepID=A0A8C4T5A4_ERPCA|nr:palmitoyltransferase ZDHHC18-A isoform X1 [Erpetoichthys calabaricus]
MTTETRTDTSKVVIFAVFSRIVSLVLQAVCNLLIPDHEPDAFQPPRLSKHSKFDTVVEALFGGLSRWDSEHFLFIAEHGYVFEHNFAFFPLLPLSLRAVASSLYWPLGGWLNFRSCLLLSTVVINSVLFVLNTVTLFKLSRLVLQDRLLAYYSSLLYSITPANVFMVVAYSESLFAFLSFAAMLQLEKKKITLSCVLFALATATRSNGIVNAGFLGYSQLQNCIQHLGVTRRNKNTSKLLPCVGISAWFLLLVLVGTAVILLPFGLFQYYGYKVFCNPTRRIEDLPLALIKLSNRKGYRLPDVSQELPAWCFYHWPLLYSYIQDVYWNVGFLRYYKLRQVPNFLLGLPIIVLGTQAAWRYFRTKPSFCLQLGLVRRDEMIDNTHNDGKIKANKLAQGFFSARVFVYLVHGTLLLMFGIFCMHVQVTTRFLASSSPILYWYCTQLLWDNEPLLNLESKEKQTPLSVKQQTHDKRPGSFKICPLLWKVVPRNPLTELLVNWKQTNLVTKCILGYFVSYWVLGLLLHCNFLPWT